MTSLHEYLLITYHKLLIVCFGQIESKLVFETRAATAAYTNAQKVVIPYAKFFA